MRTAHDPRDLAPEALLSLKQVARLLNTSTLYVKERIARGEIAYVLVGAKGNKRIPRKAVTRWMTAPFFIASQAVVLPIVYLRLFRV